MVAAVQRSLRRRRQRLSMLPSQEQIKQETGEEERGETLRSWWEGGENKRVERRRRGSGERREGGRDKISDTSSPPSLPLSPFPCRAKPLSKRRRRVDGQTLSSFVLLQRPSSSSSSSEGGNREGGLQLFRSKHKPGGRNGRRMEKGRERERESGCSNQSSFSLFVEKDFRGQTTPLSLPCHRTRLTAHAKERRPAGLSYSASLLFFKRGEENPKPKSTSWEKNSSAVSSPRPSSSFSFLFSLVTRRLIHCPCLESERDLLTSLLWGDGSPFFFCLSVLARQECFRSI